MVHLVPGGVFHRLCVQTLSGWVFAPCYAVNCSSEDEPPFPDGRFGALDIRLPEGRHVREVGAVDTTLGAETSPQDIEVRLSELVLLS